MEPWVKITETLPVHALIEASAGTGKTYTIERCVLEFVLRGVPIPEILLVTFTEKAAMELRSRVRNILLQKTAETQIETHRKILRQATATFDSAVITTLHGFAQRVLSWFALYTPYPYEQEVRTLDEILSDTVRQLVRGAWWQESDTKAALESMLIENHGRLDAVIDILRACIELPIPLRFANFSETITDLRNENDWENVFKDVFSLSKMKRDKIDFWRTQLEEFFHAPHWHDSIRILAEIHPKTRSIFLQNCELALDKIDARHTSFLRRFIQSAQQIPDLYKSKIHQACMVLLPSLQDALEKEKRRLFAMTYSDMLTRLESALQHPETGPLLIAQLHRRFSVGIVDEFQDTDELQWSILKRVFLENTRGSLVVVGDPKQAIYRFRGADIYTYQYAKKELRETYGALTFCLNQNYRCTPEMVQAVNAFFGGDGPTSFFTKQNVQYDNALGCGNPGLRLYPRRAPMVFLGQTYCSHIKRHRWRFLLAQQIAQEIQRIVQGEYQLEEPRSAMASSVDRPLRYRDIMIVVPKHSEGRIVATQLREGGIPFAFYKRQTLFEGVEARMILDVLRAILDPSIPTVRHRAFITPFFGMYTLEIAQTGLVMANHPAMLFLFSLHENARQGKYIETLRRLEFESGVYRRLASFVSTRRDAINYERIFSILRHLIMTRLWTLQQVYDALESWNRGTEIDPEIAELAMEVTDPNEDAVRILTMHNAKGLEAPIVFLYGGFSASLTPKVKIYHSPHEHKRVVLVGSFNNKKEKEQYEHEEEGDAERLMYVAMTRAKALCFVQMLAEELNSNNQDKPFFRGVASTAIKRMQNMQADTSIFETQIEKVLCPICQQNHATVQEPQKDVPPKVLDLSIQQPWEEVKIDPLQWIQRQSMLLSYSSLKKHQIDTAIEEREEWEANLLLNVPEGEPVPGTQTGLAIHTLCELVDITELRAQPQREVWLDAPEREATIRRQLRRFGLPESQWRRFGEMVYAAYCTPVITETIALPPLCQASAWVREAEFRIPWDDALQTHVAEFFPNVPRASGSVMGYFDVLVELEGKLWLVDWKTDVLPDYSAPSVQAHVCSHYALQAVIYKEALLRMRPSLPYGGFLYMFVRGLEKGEGIAVLLPDWRPTRK